MKKTIRLLLLLIMIKISASAQLVSEELSKITISPGETVSVILTLNDSINRSMKEVIKSNWKACKYEFVTLEEISNREKLADYYLAMVISKGSNTSGYSENRAYTDFGKSNTDIVKACKKYKKSKDKAENVFLRELCSILLVRTFLDPSLIDHYFFHMGGGGIRFNNRESIDNVLKLKDFENSVVLNVKTINWLLTSDLTTYFPKEKGSGGDMHKASEKYNSNSCELKKVTLLVSASDTVKGKKSEILKNFDVNEFKEYYNYKLVIETPEKIKEYISTDKENKYAILIQGIYERTPYCFIFRLNDGAILFGAYVANATAFGYTKRTYKLFKDLCK